MTDVPDLSKEAQLNPGERVPCPCNCGVVAVPKRKPAKDGLNHAIGCKCRPCIGRRSRKKGQDSQGRARRALGVPTAKYRGKNAHEENWRDPLLIWEHKHDAENAKPVVGAFRRMEAQALASKAIGDPRQVATSVEWDGLGLALLPWPVYRLLRDAYDYLYGGAA